MRHWLAKHEVCRSASILRQGEIAHAKLHRSCPCTSHFRLRHTQTLTHSHICMHARIAQRGNALIWATLCHMSCASTTREDRVGAKTDVRMCAFFLWWWWWGGGCEFFVHAVRMSMLFDCRCSVPYSWLRRRIYICMSMQEPSTCKYVVRFLTPYLCDHEKFRKEESRFSYIDCFPIVDDPPPATAPSGDTLSSSSHSTARQQVEDDDKTRPPHNLDEL